MATPSYVDVPRPISSSSTRLRALAPCRIALVSLISTMKVDWPRTRLSDAPTRVNSRSTTPTTARRAGTNAPICVSSTHSPTWRNSVDFPAMFGPVSTITRPRASRSTSFGMNASRAIMRSTTGWRLPSRAIAVRIRHLDVVAEHLVEPDLERGDPRALALTRLQARDVVLAAVAGVLELVELAIVAGADRVPVGCLGRRTLYQGAAELLAQVLEQVEAVRRLLEQRGPPPAFEAVQRAPRVREAEQRVAQGAQLARRGPPERGPTRQALEVAHAVERLPQAVAPAHVAGEHLHGIEPCVDPRRLDQRGQEPAPQQARTHRRHGPVEHVEQRRSLSSRLDA